MNEVEPKLNEQELESLLEAMLLHYGYDFRQYSRESVCRRVRKRLHEEQLDTLHQLQQRVVTDPSAADALLKSLSINVTEMFRDPDFYRHIRKHALPVLAQDPHFKIWDAGCASGEEAYSIAILLTEEQLYDRCLIYATDFNNSVLDQAKKGILDISRMRSNSKNYFAAGGLRSLSDYCHSNYGSSVLHRELLRNISFFHHNLTSDQPLPNVQMVVCRNVLIYFNQELQNHVLNVFLESLTVGGFLCLGSHESIKSEHFKTRLKSVSDQYRIYQKIT